MKYSGIGGQAVIEGVMMKNQKEYAVAVRKPDDQIEVTKKTCRSLRDKSEFANLPIIRGVITFAESLAIGMKTLNYSASFFEEEEETEKKSETKESLLMGLVMVVAILLAVGIFVVGPFLISEALKRPIRSPQLRGLIEGVIRVALFVVYVKLISQMQDIKRVFMYHGAEHKSINCVENGQELTVENVRKQTTVHKRCGTSFLLVVMFVSILFFMFIVVGNIWLRMILRILLIPVIAGLSYEFIRYAGGHDNQVITVLSKPGLMLQGLTTAEPTDDMIEVAIASVEAVFDWKTFISQTDDSQPDDIQMDDTQMDESEAESDPETAATEEEDEKTEKGKKQETENQTEKKEEEKEKPAVEKPLQEILVADGEDIQIVSIDESDEEEDEILNALDRYFEAPVRDGEDEKA